MESMCWKTREFSSNNKSMKKRKGGKTHLEGINFPQFVMIFVKLELGGFNDSFDTYISE
jgi:hypothetical protein